MDILVSIIIPNYNHAPFLKQRLESVFNQTYQNFEVILLDDASTDQSPEILNEYKNHPKVSHYIVNKTNSGSPFKQWQKGISLAKGEYIWIAESDDSCELNFLEELIQHVQQGFDLVYCRSLRLENENNVKSDYFWADSLDSERWKSDYANSGELEVRDFLVYRNTIPNASACLFAKKDVEFPPDLLNMKYCGDWYFWINFLQKKNIFYKSVSLNYFRFHSKTTRSIKSLDDEILRYSEYLSVIEKARNFAKKGKIEQNERKMYLWIIEQISRSVTLKQLFSKNVFFTLKYFFWSSTLIYKIRNRIT